MMMRGILGIAEEEATDMDEEKQEREKQSVEAGS